MGENLALNMERNGFRVSVYNRSEGNEATVVSRFMEGRGSGKNFLGFTDLSSFVASIKRPRKIMMMIRAGKPVDMVIEQLLPLLEEGDIIIDGGNSNYEDTERREAMLRSRGIYYVGMGISGGEEGALNGPSIMPGGAQEAWPQIAPIYTKIAAKAPDGSPCCAWIGSGGAGHFVKMVHNGIEYGDMQLIAEAYGLMKHIEGVDQRLMSETFAQWNKGLLNSYLIEITAQILNYKEADGSYLIDKILDRAGQKGTGKWSVITSLEYGMPLNLISTAVYERCLSALLEERKLASELYPTRDPELKREVLDKIQSALYASKLVSYAQGFALMAKASQEKSWHLDLSTIAKIWRAGCIIRSQFLDSIARAYQETPQLENLLLDRLFSEQIKAALPEWKEVTATALEHEISTPAFSSAINYFYSLKTRRLPANMLQAQRDFFGAHTYERIDREAGQFFHTNWTGTGGDTSSTTYNN